MKQKTTVEPDKPTCEQCNKEIPPSVALSSEGSDYIRYFCGTECYDEWLHRKAGKPGTSRNQPDTPR